MNGHEWLGRLRAKLGKWPFRGPEPADSAELTAVERSLSEPDISEMGSEGTQDRRFDDGQPEE